MCRSSQLASTDPPSGERDEEQGAVSISTLILQDAGLPSPPSSSPARLSPRVLTTITSELASSSSQASSPINIRSTSLSLAVEHASDSSQSPVILRPPPAPASSVEVSPTLQAHTILARPLESNSSAAEALPFHTAVGLDPVRRSRLRSEPGERVSMRSGRNKDGGGPDTADLVRAIELSRLSLQGEFTSLLLCVMSSN